MVAGFPEIRTTGLELGEFARAARCLRHEASLLAVLGRLVDPASLEDRCG